MRLPKNIHDEIVTTVTTIVKSAVNELEDRILKRMTQTRLEPIVEHQAPAWVCPVTEKKALPLEQVRFSQLGGGAVFRLWAGSQPLMKLAWEDSYTVSMSRGANAFYLRTGQTVVVNADKTVVPLKHTITIDKE